VGVVAIYFPAKMSVNSVVVAAAANLEALNAVLGWADKTMQALVQDAGTLQGDAAAAAAVLVAPVLATVASAAMVDIKVCHQSATDDFDEADMDEAGGGEADRCALSYILLRVESSKKKEKTKKKKKKRKLAQTQPLFCASSLTTDELKEFKELQIVGVKVGQTSPLSSTFEGSMVVGEVTAAQFEKTLRCRTLQAAATHHDQQLYFLGAACTLADAPIAKTRPAGVNVENELRVTVAACAGLELQENPTTATRLKDWFKVTDEGQFREQQAELFANAAATLQDAVAAAL
jgi:hypothetical protein